MSFDAESIFNHIQKKEQEQSAVAGTAAAFTNPVILKPKVDTSYSLRLLWFPPSNNCGREYPMINQFIHYYWDEAAAGNKGKTVYCPTSQYLKGDTRAGFDACPICSECSNLYKKGQEGSTSAEKLYKTFRRSLRGYIPVYIEKGPAELIGQIKVLQYGKQIKDFFDRKIFGIVPKSRKGEETQPIDPEEVIGLDAFMYKKDNEIITTGFNLNISVATKKIVINGKSIDMPTYTLDFSRKNTNITSFGSRLITTDVFDGLNEELGYDKDFYQKSTDEELKAFAVKYLNACETTSDENESTDTTNMANLNPYNNTTTTTVTPVINEKPVQASTASTTVDDIGDIDLDKLLDQVSN